MKAQRQKLIAINNLPDHVHLLIGQRPDSELSELVGDIKGGYMGLFRRLADRLFRKVPSREEQGEEVDLQDEPAMLSIYGDGREVDRLLAEDFGLDPVWPREVLEGRFYNARRMQEETGDPDLLDEMIDACRKILERAEAGSPDAMVWTGNLATSLRTNAVSRHDDDQLNEAIDLLEPMQEWFPADDANRAVAMSNLASALRSRYRWGGGDPEDLDRAIRLGEAALAICSERARAGLLNNLANALYDRFDRSGVRDDLDLSIETERKGLETAPEGSPVARILRVNLGLNLLERSSLDDNEKERDEAIEIIERPATPFGASLLEDPRVLHLLGAALLRCYVRTGDESCLERSVQMIERGLDLLPQPSSERASLLINLSGALRDRFDLCGDRRDVDRAISAAEEATAIESEEAGAWNNFGNALLQKFNLTQNGDDLDKAVDACRRAAELGADESDPALYTNSYGVTLRTRYLLRKDEADLEHTIELFRRAATEAPPGSPERPRALGNLGVALELQTDTDAPIAEAFERAAVEGLRTSVQLGLTSALRWGKWAFERHDWPEAVKAFDHASRAAQLMFEAQLLRAAKERALERVQGLAASAAFALTKTGDAEAAVVALEAGLARLLSQALDRGRIELNRLADVDPDLFARYDTASGRLSWLLAAPPADGSPRRFEEDEVEEPRDRAAEASAARKELRRVIEEIRGRPGFDGFLAALTLGDLQSLVSPHTGIDALVYLASISAGSFAWILIADEVVPVSLDIDFDGVVDLLGRPGTQGYLEGAAYGGDWLPDLLPQLLADVDDRIVAPVAARLRALGAWRVALVPVGLLGLLPLHAARHFDDLTISYAPNGASLRAALQEARRRASSPVLVGVGNPLPSHQPLPGAEAELASIAALFPDSGRRVFFGTAATREALLAEVSEATHLHLSCHGVFDARRPLQSSFELANSTLTLGDLLKGEARPDAARLAFLSACQSALTDFQSLPEEVIGFPAGFLQAGLPGVVATLWPVNDQATALLAVKFYELHLGGLPPVEALRLTQRWLRTANADELAAFIVQHPRLRDVGVAPFVNEPFAWAGFAFYGA